MDASFDTIKVGRMANANHPIPAEVARLLISPLVGEMAGRPEGGAKDRHPRLFQA